MKTLTYLRCKLIKTRRIKSVFSPPTASKAMVWIKLMQNILNGYVYIEEMNGNSKKEYMIDETMNL